MPPDLAPSLGGRKMHKIDKMAGIGDSMASIHQMLGIGLPPISTILRGGARWSRWSRRQMLGTG